MIKLNLQFFGGRGGSGGKRANSSTGTSDAGKPAGERNPDRITGRNLTSPRDMSNQIYDMISPNSEIASRFEDQERTATIRTYMDRVLQNPRSFRSEWLTNQRVANFADEHGGGRRFPKLKAYKEAIKKQEDNRRLSNAMAAGIRRAEENEKKRREEGRRIAENMRRKSK